MHWLTQMFMNGWMIYQSVAMRATIRRHILSYSSPRWQVMAWCWYHQLYNWEAEEGSCPRAQKRRGSKTASPNIL